MTPSPADPPQETWPVDVAGFPVALPIVPIRPDFAVSLMMVIDLGVSFGEHAEKALAKKLAPLEPDIVVGAATLRIPVAIEVTRALGLDGYVILQKTPKIHLADARAQAITSITSKGEQRLLLDRRSEPKIAWWWTTSSRRDRALRVPWRSCARLMETWSAPGSFSPRRTPGSPSSAPTRRW